MIGKIIRVPLRNVWKSESANFTPWLQDNIDVVGEALGLSLSNAEKEQSAGSFSVDLVAEDDDGGAVVIENQLEKSDHDHLGKLITYLTALESKKAIWIVADPRPEHVRAISWLNESSSAEFYLVKVEAICIGDSQPAPLFTLIVGPSEESKAVGKTKKELADRYVFRRQFQESLLDLAKSKTKLHANNAPTQSIYLRASAGKSGLGFDYLTRQHESTVQLYIDRGKESDEENKKLFDQLASSKDAIELEFGAQLDWQRLENARASWIRAPFTQGGYRDESDWPAIQSRLVDSMIRFENALRPHIAKLP